MGALVDEIAHPTFLPFPVIAARLLFAALLGALIGFERQWQARPAGLRTHILICVAAATFGILTVEISHSSAFAGRQTASDPLRAVEAVTAGVAFLVAGSILFTRGEVQGLTTGAGMWLAGAVGLSSGFGLWQIAGLGTFLVLVVMSLLYALERKLGLSANRKSAGNDDASKRAGKDAEKDDTDREC